MYQDLAALSTQIFLWLNNVVVLVFSNALITIFTAIWAVRKVSKLLNIIH